MRFGKTTVCILAMILLFTHSGWAGMGEEMDKMFGSMINVTNPTGYMDQSRGVVSGGHLVVKNRIVNQQLMGFDPPTVDSGCGGIDLYGASFSFISKDEAIALMRAIGANTVSYAFNLAMQGMCPSCAATIADIKKTIEKMNGLASNSCQTAKDLLSSYDLKAPYVIGSGLEQSEFTGLSTKLGSFGDWFNGLDTLHADQSASSSLPDDANPLLGNIAWKVIAKASDDAKKMTDWFEHGDESLAEIMMSVTGTLLLTKPEKNSAGQQSNSKASVKVDPYPPLIDVADIMGRAGEDQKTIRIWSCSLPTSTDPDCKGIEKKEIEFETMITRVRKILLGDGETAGIVTKFVTNNGELNSEEISFLDNIPVHGKRIRDLAISSPTSANIYADKAAESIAFEMTSNLLTQIIHAIKLAAAMRPDSNSPQYIAMVTEVQDQLVAQETSIAEHIASANSLHSLFQALQAGSQRMDWAAMTSLLEKQPGSVSN